MNTSEKERYSRHLLLSEIGESGQEKLRKASVLLVGVGGLGSPISLYLTAAGVGRIGLVDGDVVSESNLQRQVLYREAEVGLLKTECAKGRLQQLSSYTQLESYPTRLTAENGAAILAEYDLVIDGCDNFATRYLLNDLCRELGKPYVYGSIGEFYGQLSVFNYQGGCSYRQLYPHEEELSHRPTRTLGVLGVVPGVIGTLQANEAIKIITGCGEVLSGKLFSINLLTLETHLLKIE